MALRFEDNIVVHVDTSYFYIYLVFWTNIWILR